MFEEAGWRQVGAGDWALVFADPDNLLAARVTPFDPGYRLFAVDCLSGPPNRWLPRMVEVRPLLRDGYVVVMERLWSAEPETASAFCAALGIPNDTGYDPPVPGPEVSAEAPDLPALRDRIGALLAAGQARYRQWGGSDVREGSVMVDRDGALKLVDPVGVAGWRIVAALKEGRTDLLTDFSRQQLEDFLSIPYFGPGREGHDERGELLGMVERLIAS